ncbi:hypothetical protein ACFQFC_16280 [Amorphoplanes digitatis]|uniref:FtsH ternary system domain-containing protein n=1 Tax=Actinoplanes digitatis TaxID=1868 RepID=A0A7W7MTH0_9ACTN|nr:hypothetical protein [Actinoplanes digitatis]MBB4765770.1 hypothetical protein [Actinoplanes digitatis]GID93438.1 hypothetical protein Adi01nite_28500 [Actinoplanes digitatis]
MEALTTAREVLRWSMRPAGPPPAGRLTRIGGLARPDAATADTLRWATATTAARIGAGRPPLGDPGAPGPAAVLLAAAIGGRRQWEQSAKVLSLVPRLRLTRRDAGWAEGVARHAVVGPAVSAEPPAGGAPAEFVEALLAASPLTTVLHRPPDADRATAGGVLSRLLRRPRGIAVLVAACAAPSADPLVLEWRWTVLDRLRQERVADMLDVYIAARLWHGPAWDAHIEEARRGLTGLPSPRTVATLRFWLPLAILDEQEQRESGLAYRVERGGAVLAAPGTSIKGRILLDHAEYGPVLELVNRHRASLQNGGA